MRALPVLLALVACPFLAGMSQLPGRSICDNGLGDEHRSAPGQLHAHQGLCVLQDPPAPPPPPPAGTAAISGTVFDFGVLGYPGLANWVVELTGTVTATTTTDASGTYVFTGLPAGTYTVCEQVQSGWRQTWPPSGTPCPTGVGYTFGLANGEGGLAVGFGNSSSP